MLFVTLILCCLMQAVIGANRCHCLNEGVCQVDFTCKCPSGFYGPICNQYAESYTIQFESTPSGVRTIDITTGLKTDLENLKIQDAVATGLGNLYTVTFHKALTEDEKDRLKAVAVSVSNKEPVTDLIDYNECIDGKQSCFSGLKCVNTPFSFQCGCPDGFEVKENRCIQEVDSNAKTVIYVWAGAVGAVILFTLGCLMFYRHRKIEKGKKIAIEQQQKKMAMRGNLTPTNLSEYEGQQGRRASPTASVVDGHMRYSMGDVASVYSYGNGNYGQDNAYYGTQTRLAIPMDAGQGNGGYEPNADQMRYPSTGSYGAGAPMGSYGMSGQDVDQMGMYNDRSLPQSMPNMGSSPVNETTIQFANTTEETQ